jgi:hypothetical protein
MSMLKTSLTGPNQPDQDLSVSHEQQRVMSRVHAQTLGVMLNIPPKAPKLVTEHNSLLVLVVRKGETSATVKDKYFGRLLYDRIGCQSGLLGPRGWSSTLNWLPHWQLDY